MLTHLSGLEAGYGGVWAPNFGGSAPGVKPRTSCMRVRSRSRYATGAAPQKGSFFSMDFTTKLFFLYRRTFRNVVPGSKGGGGPNSSNGRFVSPKTTANATYYHGGGGPWPPPPTGERQHHRRFPTAHYVHPAANYPNLVRSIV